MEAAVLVPLVVSVASENVKTMIEEYRGSLTAIVEAEATALGTALNSLRDIFDKHEIDRRQELVNNEQFREWREEVRRFVYDMDDMVDILVLTTPPLKFTSSLKLLASSRSNLRKFRRLKDRVTHIVKQLTDIGVKRYDEGPSNINNYNNYYNNNLGGDHDGHVSHEPAVWVGHPPEHNSSSFVVGIKADVEKLVKMVLAKESPNDVVVIGGIGGSGKTTLANKVYCHQNVKTGFDHHVWVSFPQEWNDSFLDSLLSKILKRLVLVEDEVSYGGQKLREEFQNLLLNNKCLVVLDNVWNWKLLQEKFLDQVLLVQEPTTTTTTTTKTESKIVITSRRCLQWQDTRLTWGYHETKLLSNEDSLELFNKMSMSRRGGRQLAREYQGLAMEMLGKCKGLPLAIEALGRLLKNKDTLEEWERVRSQLKGEDSSYLYGPVTDILALSYYDLPHYLKPYFLYSGLLGEESISAGSLKRLWIAEGFIKPHMNNNNNNSSNNNNNNNNNETVEDAAKRILQELVHHTMVQVVTYTYTRKVRTIQVHNLMRDVCIRIAQELDFLTLCSSPSHQPISRRAAIDLSKSAVVLPEKNSNLRSLMLFGKSTSSRQQGIVDLTQVFEKFKLLRVLDIKGIKTYDGAMPKELGNLIHLRYLGIRSTNIQLLPKSLGKLTKLLTLDYWDVYGVTETITYPNVFSKLLKLRHLFLPNDLMTTTPPNLKLDTLKELQTLWGVKGGQWMLQEMATLSTSLTKLFIHGISSEQQLEAVFDNCPALKEDGRLYSLVLDWYGFEFSIDKVICSKGGHLRKMRLLGRAPDKSKPVAFPSQLGKLELLYTHLTDEQTMKSLGNNMPQLKFLKLGKDSFMGENWVVKENAFPRLEDLYLSDLPNLKTWEIMVEKGSSMPCLKKLSIISCTSLQKLPQELKSITTLETVEIRRMTTAFNIRVRQGGDCHHIVQHIPNITILDSCTPLSF